MDNRNINEHQNAAKQLLEGSAPERKEELVKLWSKYSPSFKLLPEDGEGGKFVLQGGMYRHVWFNHRAMRAFWLGSFIAWEGYNNIVNAATLKEYDTSRYDEMLEIFFHMIKSDKSYDIKLPHDIPEPGVYVDKDVNTEYRATAELATIATGWAILHEIRHIQLQQDGESAGHDSTIDENHIEEYACDKFATQFLLEKANVYADSNGVDYESVKLKRELAIYFSLFCMTLISHDNWEATDTHPSLQDRINRIVSIMGCSKTSQSGAIGIFAFVPIWKKWQNSPGPFIS